MGRQDEMKLDLTKPEGRIRMGEAAERLFGENSLIAKSGLSSCSVNDAFCIKSYDCSSPLLFGEVERLVECLRRLGWS